MTGQTSAIAFQQYLWDNYEAGTARFASGISAFPSIHVAMVTMNALFLWEWSRKIGLAGFAYVAIILASSVCLAWHYAIDGYVSILVVTVLHAMLRRFFPPRQPASSGTMEERYALTAPAGP